jgi:hypothetical protein
VVKNRLHFRRPNVIQSPDDRLKKLINIIEDMTCKQCLDMAQKPEVEWCQVRTIWRMRNSQERMFIKGFFDALEE